MMNGRDCDGCDGNEGRNGNVPQKFLDACEKLNPADPDFVYEDFWTTFKCNIWGYYQKHAPGESNQIDLDIDKLTEELNAHKIKAEYNVIVRKIGKYLANFAWLILSQISEVRYYGNILATNLDRWNKLAIKKDPDYVFPDPLILALFHIHHAIRHYECEMLAKYNGLIEQFRQDSDNENVTTQLLLMAIKDGKHNIVDYLIEAGFNINEFYWEHFQRRFPPKMSTRKIFQLLTSSA
jgi:hypothetical protein